MISSERNERRIDDFSNQRENDIQRFISYAQEQSRIWREQAQQEIKQQARRYDD